MKLRKLIANLGYGSRTQVGYLFKNGRITDKHGKALAAEDQHESVDGILIDNEPLDPLPNLVIMLNKPVDYTCSTSDPGRIIYELLPPRFRLRNPILASVGRLDRNTSGMLLMTDDGQLLQRIIHPKRKHAKVYEATLARDLRGNEGDLFATGTLMLESEETPLLPAHLEVIDKRHARLTITEGRYHQVRRMFAAVGNHVEQLHRSRVGGLELGDLESGQWRVLSLDEVQSLFVIGSP
jgi:16S rRNA pseudouridine516 synthase